MINYLARRGCPPESRIAIIGVPLMYVNRGGGGGVVMNCGVAVAVDGLTACCCRPSAISSAVN